MSDMTGSEPCLKCGLALEEHGTVADMDGEDYVFCPRGKLGLLRFLKEHEYDWSHAPYRSPSRRKAQKAVQP